MSEKNSRDPIYLELEGENRLIWERLREKFFGVLGHAADNLKYDDEKKDDNSHEVLEDLTKLGMGLLKAIVSGPELKNKAAIADIMLKVEEMRKTRAETEHIEAISRGIELDNKLKELAIIKQAGEMFFIIPRSKPNAALPQSPKLLKEKKDDETED